MSQIQVPKGWSIEPLKNMCDFFVPMRDKPKEFDGTIPWLRIDEINGKFINECLLKGECKFLHTALYCLLAQLNSPRLHSLQSSRQNQ